MGGKASKKLRGLEPIHNVDGNVLLIKGIGLSIIRYPDDHVVGIVLIRIGRGLEVGRLNEGQFAGHGIDSEIVPGKCSKVFEMP